MNKNQEKNKWEKILEISLQQMDNKTSRNIWENNNYLANMSQLKVRNSAL